MFERCYRSMMDSWFLNVHSVETFLNIEIITHLNVRVIISLSSTQMRYPAKLSSKTSSTSSQIQVPNYCIFLVLTSAPDILKDGWINTRSRSMKWVGSIGRIIK